jgi:putative oxidoreductase
LFIELHNRKHQVGATTAPVAENKPMIDNRTAPYGLFALRTALGIMFIAHAYLKFAIFTVPGFEAFLAQVGMPTALAWPIILAEFVGGVAILIGVQARLAQILLLPVLLGALVVHAPNGWVFNATNGGWEYPAFLAIAGIAHILAGDGAFALKPSQLPLVQRLQLQAA